MTWVNMRLVDLSRIAPSIVAGSAVAAFGFAFGRDIYKVTKKSIGFIFIIAVVVLSFLGTYSAGILMARNQKTLSRRVLSIFGAITIFLVSSFLLYVVLAVLHPLTIEVARKTAQFFGGSQAAGYSVSVLRIFEYQTCTVTELVRSLIGNEVLFIMACEPNWTSQLDLETRTVLSANIILAHSIFAGGIISGMLQRSRRALAWEAEELNRTFMEDHGLINNPDGTYTDGNRNSYRIEHVTSRHIALFAIGRRNRCAYLVLDDTGRFIEWTGLVIRS
jgi:hypothetical protein